MLYKLTENHGKLEAIPFEDFADNGLLEKDLENLLAAHLFDVLFEDNPLLAFHQERRRQEEADIYAIDADGNIVIFELKRSGAEKSAIDQLFRYCQETANWTYNDLDAKYKAYMKNSSLVGKSLIDAHAELFGLDQKLSGTDFNCKQRMIVVGSASDNGLRNAITYWQAKGLDIDFAPYRVYKIQSEFYFEFFSKPFDHHTNPAHRKGVLFDTNRKDNEDELFRMITKERVSAFGSSKDEARCLKKGDFVFYSHKGVGIVSAARVISDVRPDQAEELFAEVEFLTQTPKKGQPVKAMPFSDVKKFLKHNFWWAKTAKVPYLSRNESELLLIELKKYLV